MSKVIEPIALEIPEVPEESPFDTVQIKLHRTKSGGNGQYVNVNDHNFFVPYNKVVNVPRYIAEVVENSVAQDEATYERIVAAEEAANF